MNINRQKLKLCPFCGSQIRIFVCDDEGNLHFDDYEKDPWSGLGYKLYHDIEDTPTKPCPIARHEGEGEMGVWIYDTREEAIEAWNKRAEPPADQWIPCDRELPKENGKYFVTVWDEIIGLYTMEWQFYNGKFAPFTYHTERKFLAWMPLPEPYKGVE